MRLAKARQPRLLVGENVAGLLSHDGGDTFETILEAMGELGYSVEWQVINSKYYLPQNRERVFIIGHSRTECTKKIFPITKSNGTADGVQGCKANTITAHTGGSNSIGTYIIESEQPTQGRGTGLKQIPGNLYGTNIEPNPAAGRVYDPSGIAPALLNPSGGGHRETKNAIPVLTPDRAEKRQNGRRFKNDGEPMFTLTAQDRHGVAVAGIYTGVSESHQRGALRDCSRAIKGEKHDAGVIIRQRGHGFNKGGIHKIAPTLSSHAYAENNLLDDGLRIRKLTPRECFRLQGFPDEYFDRAAAVNSDSQLYKQAGNSVTVPVVYEIAKAIKEAYEK
jgi:DNA (cytosine-5)-methyltransferase 1